MTAVLGFTLFVGVVFGMTSAAGTAENQLMDAVRVCETDAPQDFRACLAEAGADLTTDGGDQP
ncbi:hypothetical protein PTQ19_12100 [Microbacterium esteraromaticum]|uniref:hypothetical protein n=1 Tax=Microbacterium esteraromaticum TaxID=57043 RepID=UPI0023680084|nr:hypothetical protein [Microbacterium esteraromaticum]WDH78253.1 hypothetical protein PTQ19_12100 [Microbacterium esteraromaticum]